MKDYSKYLEGLRIRPDREEQLRRRAPKCEWPGCEEPGTHPAPRDREGEYFCFCTEHVRRYNKSYNYFSGMADAELREWLERNLTGHRPTWRFGANAFQATGRKAGAGAHAFRRARPWIDPFELFEERGQGGSSASSARRRHNLPPTVVGALETLGLQPGATREEIKARYKALVKKLHPDANRGSRATEARLREVIHAYQRLRKARMV